MAAVSYEFHLKYGRPITEPEGVTEPEAEGEAQGATQRAMVGVTSGGATVEDEGPWEDLKLTALCAGEALFCAMLAALAAMPTDTTATPKQLNEVLSWVGRLQVCDGYVTAT